MCLCFSGCVQDVIAIVYTTMDEKFVDVVQSKLDKSIISLRLHFMHENVCPGHVSTAKGHSATRETHCTAFAEAFVSSVHVTPVRNPRKND